MSEAKEINWHKLAHKLREHNRKLLKKVFQLEQEITDNKEALAEQIRISQSNDLYVAKQAEKIESFQKEIAELLKVISQQKKEQNYQQETIDNLKQQLLNSEATVIELKEECEDLQLSDRQKDDELLSSKQQIQELNTRFYRQQQHFLQYKANQKEKRADSSIKAWSVESTNIKIEKTTISQSIEKADWPAPKLENEPHPINSIAAVKLPKFLRQVEVEELS